MWSYVHRPRPMCNVKAPYLLRVLLVLLVVVVGWWSWWWRPLLPFGCTNTRPAAPDRTETGGSKVREREGGQGQKVSREREGRVKRLAERGRAGSKG